MQRLPLAALSVLPVRLGLGRVSFYDQATVIRRVSGLPHGGVDFGAQEGTPILSATQGRVPNELVIGGERVPGVGYRQASGHYVVVVDPAGYFFYYFHLQAEPDLSPGDCVTPGQEIGRMGNSGLAERSANAPVHLHFQAVGDLRHDRRAEGWYRELTFPVRNLRNRDPFPALARLAAAVPGAVRTRSEVQGVMREGFILDP